MGLLSNAIGAVKSVITGTKELVVSVAATSPQQAIKERIIAKTDTNFTTEEKTIIKTTAVGAAVVATGMGVAAFPSIIIGAVKVIPKAVAAVPKAVAITKSALVAGVAGLFAYGYVKERGVGTAIGDVANVGGKAAAAATEVGQEVASLIEKPTIENGLRIIKEHPFISAAAAIALLGTLGYGASMIAGIISRAKTNGLLEDIKKGVENPPPLPLPPDYLTYTPTPYFNDNNPPVPVTPETEVLTPTGKITKHHHHKKTPTIINQTMRVLIQNSNGVVARKRYLNNQIHHY